VPAACKTADGEEGKVQSTMDTRKHSDVVEQDRGRKMGVSGGRPCAACGAVVHWRIEKFCLQHRQRFGGRIYCMRCQASVLRSS
jgi:hypothetical protein